jgi:DNA repair protein RadC
MIMESTNEKALFEVSEIQLSCSQKLRLLYVQSFHRQEMRRTFKLMLLNRYNKVIGIFTVSSGGIAGTVADPKLIFG